MRPRVKIVPFCIFALLVMTNSAAAGLDLSWHTIDGGGSMYVTVGGGVELNASLAQPDVATLAGGDLTLVGGFWAALGGSGPAVCPGDLNCDDWVSFDDINPFILALSNWNEWKQRYPDCPEQNADVNGDGRYGGGQGFGDINPFINLLASGGGRPIPCP